MWQGFCIRNAANVLALRARDCRGGGAVAELSNAKCSNEGSTKCVRNPEKPGLPLGRSARIQREKKSRLSNLWKTWDANFLQFFTNWSKYEKK